ncbi:cytoadherence linked protein, putative [Plasmodium relictum]|uniref:Cytoadherence linked protein, putative n=1 Tax=Plasmodium relictum TaxID=85471 RepID=A0A1J1H6K9_PLARL|nr:cytoadherence linked protein, putative [Plasmodium relictum]CRG99235.1 cytoadherence linked protein, putative [Plasmodium relictum]
MHFKCVSDYEYDDKNKQDVHISLDYDFPNKTMKVSPRSIIEKKIKNYVHLGYTTDESLNNASDISSDEKNRTNNYSDKNSDLEKHLFLLNKLVKEEEEFFINMEYYFIFSKFNTSYGKYLKFEKKKEMLKYMNNFIFKRLRGIEKSSLFECFIDGLLKISLFENNTFVLKIYNKKEKESNYFYFDHKFLLSNIGLILKQNFLMESSLQQYNIENNINTSRKFLRDIPLSCGLVVDFDYFKECFEQRGHHDMKLIDILEILDGTTYFLNMEHKYVSLHASMFGSNIDTDYKEDYHRKYYYLFDKVEETKNFFTQNGIKLNIHFYEISLYHNKHYKTMGMTEGLICDIQNMLQNEEIDNIFLFSGDKDVINYCYNSIYHRISHKINDTQEIYSFEENYISSSPKIIFSKPIIIFLFFNNLPLEFTKSENIIKIDFFCYMSFVLKSLFFRYQRRKLKEFQNDNDVNEDFINKKIDHFNEKIDEIKEPLYTILVDEFIMRFKLLNFREEKIDISQIFCSYFSSNYYILTN